MPSVQPHLTLSGLKEYEVCDGMNSMRTYDERLIEREHDDQLDRQELRERSSALELFPRQAIEEDEAVECDSTHIREASIERHEN